MKVDVIQTSFTGGEFGPQLLGRTDIAQYANACETVENMLCRSYGPAISMPGTRYVATVSDSTLRTRLIPFVFNRTDAYIIEMGDLYMRFFTDRGQVVTKSGTEDLSAFTANLKAHYKMNDNVSGTGTTLVLDATASHNGTASTVTSSLSTTAIVSTGFNLAGRYHVSVADHGDFTRTASSQPMTIATWAYYLNNGNSQAIFSKANEYELSINSSDELSFLATSGGADTKLLLHCDGTDGSQSFTDSSASSHTITASGNAQLDTAQVKFGTGAGLFDGSGDFLTVPDSADFDMAADFTIDFWVRFPTAVDDDAYIIGQQDHSSLTGGGWGILTNTGLIQFDFQDATIISVAHGFSADTWYHIAVVRSGSTVKMYKNGIEIGSGSTSASSSSTNDLKIGVQPSTGGKRSVS